MKNKWMALLFLVATGMILSGCSKEAAGEPEIYDKSDIVMGTVVTERIYTQGEDTTSEIIELLSEIEHRYLSWRKEDSDIGKINQQAGKGQAPVDEQTMGYLEQTLQIAEKSQGAFDPTIGELSLLWDVEAENPKIPGEKKINQCLQNRGYEKIRMGSDNGQDWVELEERCSIDLGAVGKGIGCDETAKFLKEDEQVQGAVIAVGGSILTLGSKPDETSWKVAIRDPRGTQEDLLGVLDLEGENYVSTSGDYEKYFMQDGKRYHHILDPSTGYPADTGLISVTVLGENGLISDGLSTACFVLGMEKGAELLEKYQAEGIFVNEEKQVYVTEGLMENFELAASGYIVFPLSS